MNILVLGRGKTGSLVAEVAEERGHEVIALGRTENLQASALTRTTLENVDVVVDFTTPQAVLENIAACAREQASMVVGTTGWYGELPRVRQMAEESGIGFLYAANFSIGVNLFFDVVRAAAPALRYGYHGHITETHHAKKKDAPSGTAAKLRSLLKETAGAELDITSIREGDVVGTHATSFDSPNDSITLTHEAKSRRGFAEGAVRAAEWLAGKKGFYDFKDIFRELA
jgi:4-hydroxy-tetrahydrodipicolinate reductase